MASLEREQIRHEHAKWSDSTFGCVGPIGPLKHLSKEALEAAAEPDDLSEWADMQFLLWDAQRRAGISDAEITVAMEDKLKINMERQWPEPKDGEPCQRQDYWPFFAIFNVRYWSLMLSAFRHFIITDWRGVF
ncbi:dATP/dGTP pyrophosphohydrolase domain-containing protein, partial [Escherichia coli]|uniref:dATP/dGTP pyrophosphohydrolase domain-containing protein n=1 Tax=Escherichia coli TaxID=562 RepID=UPI0036F203F1